MKKKKKKMLPGILFTPHHTTRVRMLWELLGKIPKPLMITLREAMTNTEDKLMWLMMVAERW